MNNEGRPLLVLWFAAFLSAPTPTLGQVNFVVPDFTVRPGETGTFDALVEFTNLPPTEPGVRVAGYSVRVVAEPQSSGFRIPSAASGLGKRRGGVLGIVTETGNAIQMENGFGTCAAVGCFPPTYSEGTYLLLRGDYQINPNVTPGTQFTLEFDPAYTRIQAEVTPYLFESGVVTVVESETTVLGGPIGPDDLPENVIVEDFDLELSSLIPVPLQVANAVITTSSGNDLNFPQYSPYAFGPAIAQQSPSESIIADLTVPTLHVGAWVGASGNREIFAEFYADDTLLGSTAVHRVYRTPVFIGFESKSGYITRAVFSTVSGRGFSIDRLTTGVPEPATAMLLVFAAAPVAFWRRRQTRSCVSKLISA